MAKEFKRDLAGGRAKQTQKKTRETEAKRHQHQPRGPSTSTGKKAPPHTSQESPGTYKEGYGNARRAASKASKSARAQKAARKATQKVYETRKDGVREHYDVNTFRGRHQQNKVNSAFELGSQRGTEHRQEGISSAEYEAYRAGEKHGMTPQTNIYPGSPGGDHPNEMDKGESDIDGSNRPVPIGNSTGHYRLYKNNPERNLDNVAGLAADYYTEYFSDMPPADGQERAARAAIDALRRDYPHADLAEVDVKSVKDSAFTAKVSKPTSRTSKSREQELQDRLDKRSGRVHWDRTQMYKAAYVKGEGPKKKSLIAGQTVKKSKTSTRDFVRNASPEEQKWIEQQHGIVTDPLTGEKKPGLFQGARGNQVPGAYRRWQRYVNARSEGFDDRDNISEWLQTDMRGKSSGTNPDRRYKKQTDKAVQNQFTSGIVRPTGTKTADRYRSMAPSHEQLGVGIRVPGIRTKTQIKAENPKATDDDVIRIQDSERQSVAELLANQRMAHEARIQTMLGKESTDNSGKGDRVVFFTTSVGSPAVSVGANSLLGQYVVRKRKQMMVQTKQATRAQVKGEYPAAVRDQHVIEVATGVSLGAQGRYGVFKHVGARVGSKATKGYGKTIPVGSQVLTDSSGQPLYDSNGNLRYTEGYTRPFDLRPGNELGLRIYLG